MKTDTKPQTYGLDHDTLLAAHRQHQHRWKWASERRIKEEYSIPSGQLEVFHDTYGLPRLKGDARRGLLYSLPALETILENVTELHDCK